MKQKMAHICALTAALIVMMGTLAGCSTSGKSSYVDGMYRAEESGYDHGYKEFVEISISGGKISKVTADAIKEDGVTLKTQDAEYKKNYEGTGNDTTPDVFYPSLAKQLEKTKNVEKVETVGGATSSSQNFKRLSAAALRNAENGTQETAVIEPEETASQQS